MLKRILVPIDFSACSLAALEYAVLLGRRFESELDLLHVWDPGRSASDRELAALGLTSSTEAGRTMREWLAAMGRDLPRRAQGRLEIGDPVARILAAASEYDLIVMGTNGRTGVAHLIRASIAEKVVRKAHCPVLTIRPAEGASVQPVLIPLLAGEFA